MKGKWSALLAEIPPFVFTLFEAPLISAPRHTPCVLQQCPQAAENMASSPQDGSSSIS